jgi:hypothetical protein
MALKDAHAAGNATTPMLRGHASILKEAQGRL